MSGQDLNPPSITVEKDPAEEVFQWFRTMHEHQSVYQSEELWQVFGYAEVSQILSDPITFSSGSTGASPVDYDVDLYARGRIVTMDPPRHRTLRALVNQLFTSRVVAGLEPRILEITRSLLDAVDGAERFDVIDVLAGPLPVIVIAELLGLPAEDLPSFQSWAEALLAGMSADATTLPGTDEQLNSVVRTIHEMNEYLLDQIRQRRCRPADDLLSRLTAAEVDGERLADEEIVGFAELLLQGGHITSTALLGNSVLCFDQNPQSAAMVRADRDLLPAAIEEVLRFRTPLPRLIRTTKTDTEIGGVAVPAGKAVVVWIAAANRDPRRFPDPGRFDICRNNINQLAFGHGIHFCFGASLARLEAKIALGVLLDRYTDIAVDHTASIEFHNPWLIVAAKQLPVKLTG